MPNHQDVMNGLLSKRRMQGANLEIQCDKVQALSYKDILELYLYFSGVGQWKWVDSGFNVISRQLILGALYGVLRDILAWPIFYGIKASTVRRLLARNWGGVSLQSSPSVLFLRTDHWFNITSGGSVGHLSGVIHGFRALGNKTRVVSTDNLAGVESDEDFYLCEPHYRLGRNIPNLPELLFNDQIDSFISSHWAAWTPSVIYQRCSLGNYAGVLLKAAHSVPLIIEYNGSFPWVARHWEKRRLFHERLLTDIELLNLKAADVIVVVSEPLRQEVVGRGIPADKILVNPNGVNHDAYSPAVDGSSVRKKYGFGNKTVIGFIGTFGKWHGAEVLAEAFGRLLKTYSALRDSTRLLMIGDGVTMPLVKDTLAKYNVADVCILTGRVPQEEGPQYLAACDILASPHVPNPDGTPFFGSPTKLFEYMAMGKAIIASNLDQIGEILEHEKTALMVKPGDPESLMLGLKRLMEDRQLRERLGKAAREEAVAKHTWEEHTRRIVEKLRDVLGGSTHGQRLEENR